MKIFNVFHLYDEDGGFGDPVGQEELIASFENKSDAEEFANLLSNPHVYDKPYADLSCGYIEVRELDVISHAEFDASKVDKAKYWWTEEARRRQMLRNIEDGWWDFTEITSDLLGALMMPEFCIYGVGEKTVRFPVGTPLTAIEAWFDANYPGGIPALKEACRCNMLHHIEDGWGEFAKTTFDMHGVSLVELRLYGVEEEKSRYEYVRFPTGTPRTVIEAWFDANYPGGIPALKQKAPGQ